MSLIKIKPSNIETTGVTAGSYTSANITVNEAGQVTSASNSTGGGGGSGLQHTTYTYTANGSTTTFAASSGITANTVLVLIDGITQVPTSDYTVSGSDVVFTSAPPANSAIQVRVLGDVAASGVGGPKIASIVVTDSSYNNLDDTAVNVGGGYIKLIGTGFVTGCQVVIGTLVATSVTFISSTEVRAQIPAQAAGTYTVYLTNSDGGVAIRVNAVNYSSTPTWTTTSPLSSSLKNTSISLQLVATSNSSVTYSLASGSTLPGGLTLSSSGLITGTTPDIVNETTYNFTVVATDGENQDTPQAFQVTITVNDPYFEYVTLLLNNQTNNVLTDSSTNNFNLTAFGDTRATNFTPYSTGWSLYTNDRSYLTIPASSDFDVINTDFTIEFWVNFEAFNTMTSSGNNIAGPGLSNYASSWFVNFGGSGTTVTTLNYTVMTSLSVGTSNSFTVSLNFNTWYHVAFVRSGSGAGNFKLYINGTQQGAAQNQVTYSGAGSTMVIGSGSFIQNSTYSGNSSYFLSNFRLTKSAVYLENFTPATTSLTALENTTLLLFNQSRLINAGTNTGTITSSGYTSTRAKLISFNPFGITNTGITGSAYFDGTGDYLSVTNNAAFNFGSGAFTIELWYYPITLSGTQCFVTNYGGSTTGFVIQMGGSTAGSGKIDVNLSGDGADITSTNTVQLNSWNHIAVSGTPGATGIKLFINGNQEGSTYTGATSLDTSATLLIGEVASTNRLSGYLSGLRLLKGTAQYTANFTPPTQPLTAVANTQLLTLQYKQPHNNHSFQDSSTNNHLITRSGNATQGTFSPFSQTGWSGYFDGTGDYLTVPDNVALRFGTGDFNIEFWYNGIVGTTNSHFVISKFTAGSFPSQMAYVVGVVRTDHPTNPRGITVYLGSTSFLVGSGNIQDNTWYHIAVTRESGSVKVFINGTQVGTTQTITNDITNTSTLFIGASNDASSLVTGYVSNVRIVNGAAVYTSNFTPSTTPLTTTISGGTVSLLTCQSNRFIDNSTNNFAITRNGDTRVVAFSPFNPTASWSAAANGGSGYFDGSGDYLTTPNVTALNLYNTTNTVECWVYLTSFGVNGTLIYGTDFDGTYYTLWTISSSGVPAYGSRNGTGINSPTAIKLNEWNHIAWGRSGSSVSIWINGVRSINQAITTEDQWGAGLITVGRFNGQDRFSGYLSGLRVIKGTDVYGVNNTTITVPTAPLTAITNTSLLLNFTNAGIYDATSKNDLETVGSAQISTAQSKFGGSSMSFDGTGDYLLAPVDANPYYNFGTGDFTVECWFNANSLSVTNYAGLLGCHADGGSNNEWAAYVRSNGIFFFGSSGTLTGVAGTINTGTWYHYAASRSGNTLRLFLNGTQTTSATVTGSYITSAFGLRVGDDPNTTNPAFNGYLQDVRITKGYARYTSNFTPPTQAFLTL